VRRLLRRDQPGPYQIQAAINAVHSDPPPTDWSQIVALYDQLLAFTPTPVVRLNRAIALAETRGPRTALEEIDALEGLDRYHLFHATRAELLRRLHRDDEAEEALTAAIERTENAAARDFLKTRLSPPMNEP
jgi:RNA polymerase sigma-70 factor, ECF subfamily